MSSKRGSCKRGREDDVIGDEEEENEDEEDEEPVENIVFVYQKTMADGTVETVQIPDLQVRGGGVCGVRSWYVQVHGDGYVALEE
jgi:hypothetical protein